MLLSHLLDRLYIRLSSCLDRAPLDLDYLEFICSQELVVLSTLSNQLQIPQAVYDALTEVHRLVSGQNGKETCITVSLERGNSGRPTVVVSKEYVYELLNLGLSVKCIANFVGVSRWTLQRRMNDWGFSVRDLYSDLTDDELDALVSGHSRQQPACWVPNDVGTAAGTGTSSAVAEGSCINAQSRHCRNCVKNVRVAVCGTQDILCPRPRSLMHIDTNHKLIRLIVFDKQICCLGIM